MSELLGSYDAAVYFCAPAARAPLEDLQARYGHRLVVRELPEITTTRKERRT